MREDTQRTPEYEKNEAYEAAVAAANELLEKIPLDHPGPQRPLVLIVGLPRSGTTLLYQALAASGGFGYCTNFIARFYRRPALGALVQTLCRQWLEPPEPSFSSRAGITPGWSEPHEFGYFWESHFPFSDHHEPDGETLASLKLERLVALLGEFEATVGRSLLLKSVILPFVLPRLADAIPTLRVVRIRRPFLDVALSLLDTRRRFFGDESAWLSVRPAGMSAVASLPPERQIAFQIARVEEALDAARVACGRSRWLDIDYGELCSNPRSTVRTVAGFAAVSAQSLDLDSLPLAFETRKHDVLGDAADVLRAALAAESVA